MLPGAPDALPAAGELSRAVTDTRSPLTNGLDGVKAVPWPSGIYEVDDATSLLDHSLELGPVVLAVAIDIDFAD